MVVWGSIRNIPWTPRYKWLVCRSKKIKVLLVFASNTKPHAVYNTRLLHLCCLASHQSCHPHDGSLVSLSSMTTSQFSSRVVVSQIGIPHKAVNLESELSGESKPRTEGDLTDNQATKAMPQIDELKPRSRYSRKTWMRCRKRARGLNMPRTLSRSNEMPQGGNEPDREQK